MYCKYQSIIVTPPPPPPPPPPLSAREIDCKVVINSRAAMLQSRLTARYLALVNDLYTPAEDRLVGNLFNLS